MSAACSQGLKLAAALLLTLACAACRRDAIVMVENRDTVERVDELVAVPMADINRFVNCDGGFKILNARGEERPYRLTDDGRVVFSVEVSPRTTALYVVRPGSPSVDTSLVDRCLAPARPWVTPMTVSVR